MKHYYFLKKDKNNFEVYLNYKIVNNAHLPVTSTHTHTHTFETRPGSTRDPANPGLEPGRFNEKIEKVMTQCDPADPAG